MKKKYYYYYVDRNGELFGTAYAADSTYETIEMAIEGRQSLCVRVRKGGGAVHRQRCQRNSGIRKLRQRKYFSHWFLSFTLGGPGHVCIVIVIK